MKLQDIMSSQIESIRSNDTLQTAAKRMSEKDIGMLTVLDDDSRIIGTLTDRDICIGAVAAGLRPDQATVANAMSADVVTCSSDATLEEAGKKMAREKVRRLLVTEKDSPVGVVSLGDLARAANDPALTARTLQQVS